MQIVIKITLLCNRIHNRTSVGSVDKLSSTAVDFIRSERELE